jgi:hypothetical protein
MDKVRVLTLVVCLTFSASAFAQGAEDYSTENGIYISAQGTLMQWVAPIAPGIQNLEDTSSGATLLVGYRMLGGKLAFEVGSMDEITFREPVTAVINNVPANLSVNLGVESDFLRALWRFAGKGEASFIVGAGYHDVTYATSVTGNPAVAASFSESESETSILVGGEIDGPALTLRFAYEQFLSLADEQRNRAITFGVGYRF